MKLHPALLDTGIHQFEKKAAFHRHGLAFLRQLAEQIGLDSEEFEIRRNKGGPAVSGEVTLHADKLYIQLSESCLRPGISIMYRRCDGRKDYSGGQNNFVAMRELQSSEKSDTFIRRCKDLAGLLVDNDFDPGLR